MFLERLNSITRRIEGAVALSLVAGDGIPVESVNSDPGLDLELLAAELIAQVRVISDDHRELNVGEVRHLALTTDRFTLMVSGLAAGYYLMLVLADSASYGRARFELRRARLLFESDLS
jgi:predicted regulator of Ras-like GTPase activity (Roadblock/LC7/MglB family)